jgi:pimeloyl-ACP methyl ester carboxylesterase
VAIARHCRAFFQCTKIPKGGHFAPMEQPELLAHDIRKFVTVVQAEPQPEGFLESVLG